MKTYFEDYKKLCKESAKFYRNHWLATLLFSTIGLALTMAPIAMYQIKERKEFKKLKEKND